MVSLSLFVNNMFAICHFCWMVGCYEVWLVTHYFLNHWHNFKTTRCTVVSWTALYLRILWNLCNNFTMASFHPRSWTFCGIINKLVTYLTLCLQTTMPYAIISDVKAGHWYQFRVAAVNIYGSRGWSAPSQPFKLSKGSSLLTDIRRSY